MLHSKKVETAVDVFLCIFSHNIWVGELSVVAKSLLLRKRVKNKDKMPHSVRGPPVKHMQLEVLLLGLQWVRARKRSASFPIFHAHEERDTESRQSVEYGKDKDCV